MRKDEVNSDLVTGRVEDSPQPDWRDFSGGWDPFGSDSRAGETSEPMHLDALLPFLEERVAFKMPSDLRHLDGVLDYLNERMLRLGIVTPGDSEVLIALDEAIVNAVKHGNKCDSRKAVHIVAEFSVEGVRFTIADEGTGFELEKVPDPTQPCRLLEPSGRGLLLIHHIMDEVCFNESGNRVEMFKRATNKPPSHAQLTDGQYTVE